LALFDADAQVSSDLLRRVLRIISRQAVGGGLVRQSDVNAQENFWTQDKCQEMALDAYIAANYLWWHWELQAMVSLCDGHWNVAAAGMRKRLPDDLDCIPLAFWISGTLKFLPARRGEEEGVTY